LVRTSADIWQTALRASKNPHKQWGFDGGAGGNRTHA
jgi:hypothetical protein